MVETTPITRAHEPFLAELYASTRREEVAAWGWEPDQQAAFLQMQFLTQQRAYAMQYPGADLRLIVRDGRPVGRLMVNRTAEEILLVDIALVPEERGAGIGTELIRMLQAEAAEGCKPLRLRVLAENQAARRLYERLGFRVTGETGIHLAMEWR